MILVLLDLSAAFDTIDHDHLFELLQNRFGIKGTALDWIKSYLGNRSSSIQINSKTSPPTVTSYGVPQGSVLGPIIFTIYTTPLADIIKHHESIAFLQQHLVGEVKVLIQNFLFHRVLHVGEVKI